MLGRNPLLGQSYIDTTCTAIWINDDLVKLLDQSSVTSVFCALKLLLIILWSDVVITKVHTLVAKFAMKATDIQIVQGSPDEEKKSIPTRPMKRVSIIP